LIFVFILGLIYLNLGLENVLIMKLLTKNLALFIIFIFCVLSINMTFKNQSLNSDSSKTEEIDIIITSKSPSAGDKVDGKINIGVVGGKPPYKLTVITSTRSTPQTYTGSQFELSNLPKGFYIFSLEDAEGKFISKNINL